MGRNGEGCSALEWNKPYVGRCTVNSSQSRRTFHSSRPGLEHLGWHESRTVSVQREWGFLTEYSRNHWTGGSAVRRSRGKHLDRQRARPRATTRQRLRYVLSPQFENAEY